MKWKEVIRKLRAAGFVEVRTGKGAHKKFQHPDGRAVWVTVHGHDAGHTGDRILKEAGLK